MNQIKIYFTKVKVKEDTSANKPANVEVLELEITTDFYMSSFGIDLSKLHGGNPDGTLKKMRFGFWDNAENKIFLDLLDSSKNNYELVFDQEQVGFGIGGGISVIDDTKPEVNLYQALGSRMLEIVVKPKHNGIIKLSSVSQSPPLPRRLPDNPPEKQQQIQELETKIARLEGENQQDPNGPNNQSNKEEIKRLKKELSKLKGEDNSQQPNKNDFPIKEAAGIAVVVIIIVVLIYCFWPRKKGYRNS